MLKKTSDVSSIRTSGTTCFYHLYCPGSWPPSHLPGSNWSPGRIVDGSVDLWKVKGFPGSSENLQELLSKAETMVGEPWRMFRICHNISPKKQGNHNLNRTKLSSSHINSINWNAKVYDLCISSNAVLLYPASIIFAAAWGTALDEGWNPWMSGCCGWRFSWTRQVWDTTTKAKPERCEVMHFWLHFRYVLMLMICFVS